MSYQELKLLCQGGELPVFDEYVLAKYGFYTWLRCVHDELRRRGFIDEFLNPKSEEYDTISLMIMLRNIHASFQAKLLEFSQLDTLKELISDMSEVVRNYAVKPMWVRAIIPPTTPTHNFLTIMHPTPSTLTHSSGGVVEYETLLRKAQFSADLVASAAELVQTSIIQLALKPSTLTQSPFASSLRGGGDWQACCSLWVVLRRSFQAAFSSEHSADVYLVRRNFNYQILVFFNTIQELWGSKFKIKTSTSFQNFYSIELIIYQTSPAHSTFEGECWKSTVDVSPSPNLSHQLSVMMFTLV